MKKYIFFLLYTSSIFSQNYFPSESGNAYQTGYYHMHSSWSNPTEKWNKHVIFADTTIDGKRFIKFLQDNDGPFQGNHWYHYNQQEQKLFIKRPGDDTIRLGVDFTTPLGLSFLSYLPFPYNPLYLTSLSAPGANPYKLQFEFSQGGNQYTRLLYHFSENIGLTYVYFYQQTYHPTVESWHYEVSSAIVDGEPYNPILLKIINLSPLEYRTVGSFPFIMLSDYSSSLISWSPTKFPLVDSFYVKMIQIRGNDTIGTFQYPFNSSKLAFISLTPEIGDRLLIKAFISDTSIYRNTDVFPDSGYAQILVLPNLPVEFISFTAVENNREVLLSWSTATETNNLGFEIERRVADKWITIGFISGQGTSTEIYNYTFNDDISEIKNISIAGYRLKQVDYNGSFEYSDEVEVVFKPGEFILNQNYPNPFNPFTIIKYSIPERSYVSLIIYDAMGNEIDRLVNTEMQPGFYTYHFDGSSFASGVYFYKITADNKTAIKKMLLIK